MQEFIKEIISAESRAIQNIPVNDNFKRAVDLIYRQVHEKGGKVIASGMGKAGQIALNISTFSSTGTPAFYIHPSDAQHGDLGGIQKNDVLLLISNSGKTREILEFVELSKRLSEGLPIIVLTVNAKGELA